MPLFVCRRADTIMPLVVCRGADSIMPLVVCRRADTIMPLVVCRRAHVLFTLFVFVYVQWCLTHIVLCFCFVFLRLVYHMLSVSLNFPFLIVPSVFSNVMLQMSPCNHSFIQYLHFPTLLTFIIYTANCVKVVIMHTCYRT